MDPISKAKIKFVQSLRHKKNRKKHLAFVIEGLKSCSTLIEGGWKAKFIVSSNAELNHDFGTDVYFAEEQQMKTLTSLNTPPELIAVFVHPPALHISSIGRQNQACIYLDRIQDPGNLGTMIRTADWFGLRHIILSEGCADLYNIKTVQAAMGSLAKVVCYHGEFENLSLYLPDHAILALDMEGDRISSFESQQNEMFVLVVGNEGQGLRAEIKEQADQLLQISGDENRIAESLNAAVALAIGLHELKSGLS